MTPTHMRATTGTVGALAATLTSISRDRSEYTAPTHADTEKKSTRFFASLFSIALKSDGLHHRLEVKFYIHALSISVETPVYRVEVLYQYMNTSARRIRLSRGQLRGAYVTSKFAD